MPACNHLSFPGIYRRTRRMQTCTFKNNNERGRDMHTGMGRYHREGQPFFVSHQEITFQPSPHTEEMRTISPFLTRSGKGKHCTCAYVVVFDSLLMSDCCCCVYPQQETSATALKRYMLLGKKILQLHYNVTWAWKQNSSSDLSPTGAQAHQPTHLKPPLLLPLFPALAVPSTPLHPHIILPCLQIVCSTCSLYFVACGFHSGLYLVMLLAFSHVNPL